MIQHFKPEVTEAAMAAVGEAPRAHEVRAHVESVLIALARGDVDLGRAILTECAERFPGLPGMADALARLGGPAPAPTRVPVATPAAVPGPGAPATAVSTPGAPGAAPIAVPSAPDPRPRRVLVIAPELPLWDRASGGFRLLQILTLLRRAGHRVTFLARNGAAGLPPARYLQPLAALGVEVIPIDPERIAERFGVPAPGARVDLERLLREGAWDVVYIYFMEPAHQYLAPVRRWAPGARVVVDSVDVHFLRLGREARLTGDAEQARNAAITRDVELGVYRRADLVVAVTEDDRRALREVAPELAVAVIPNVHPLPPPATGSAPRRDLLFVGGFGHRPNADAVLWFHREIWPGVAARVPGARLLLVGGEAPEAVQALAGPRVVVAGHVPDLGPLLASARVSIAPLRYGAGMKGKIGEAMAAGLPVVTTPVGAEGFGLDPGRHALIADTADAFADAVVRVYTDDALWTQLSADGRRFIAERYAPEAVLPTLDAVIRGGARAGRWSWTWRTGSSPATPTG